jgi:hypothetical protein
MTVTPPDPGVWLRDRIAEEPPAGEVARAAAVALLEAERREAELDGLEALTPLELELVQRAYRQGELDALARVGALVGPSAVTLDANVVRRHLENVGGPELNAKLRPGFAGGARWVEPANVRAARLVAAAREDVERQAEHERELAELERREATP